MTVDATAYAAALRLTVKRLQDHGIGYPLSVVNASVAARAHLRDAGIDIGDPESLERAANAPWWSPVTALPDQQPDAVESPAVDETRAVAIDKAIAWATELIHCGCPVSVDAIAAYADRFHRVLTGGEQ